jgi:hypothetical protein
MRPVAGWIRHRNRFADPNAAPGFFHDFVIRKTVT